MLPYIDVFKYFKYSQKEKVGDFNFIYILFILLIKYHDNYFKNIIETLTFPLQ